MKKIMCALAVAGVLLFSTAYAENLQIAPPASANPRAQEIRSLLDQGKTKEAGKAVNRWLDEEKKADEPWVYLAEMAHGKKQYKKTINLAGKALKINSENASAYLWRGYAYESMKNWLEAANEFRAALMANPKLTEASIGLSRVKSNLSLPDMDARQPGPDGHP